MIRTPITLRAEGDTTETTMRARLDRLAAPAFATLAVAAIVTIVTIAFVARWRFLNSSPYPLGIDGFYYAIQLRSLLHDHRLYYPASPMAFWLMLPGAWALGPIAGAKFGGPLGTALAAAPVYAIVRRATGERAAGVAGAALVATAAGSFYLAVEFMKQGVGLTLALAFVATVGAALDAPVGRGRRARIALAAALFGATLLAHLSSVGLAVAFVVPPLWVRATRGGGARRLRTAALIAVALALLAAVVVLLVPAARNDMGLAHLFGPASREFYGGLAFHYEVPLGALAAVVLVVSVVVGLVPPRVRGPQATLRAAAPSAEARALLVGPAALALMLAIPWLSSRDPLGLVFRLRLMAFVPLAICAPAAMAQLIARAPARVPQLLSIAAAAAVLAFVPLLYVAPVRWPNPLFIQGAAAIAGHTPAGAIIIVKERQQAYMVKWAADREARTLPPSAIAARPTFRLASPGVLPRAAAAALRLRPAPPPPPPPPPPPSPLFSSFPPPPPPSPRPPRPPLLSPGPCGGGGCRNLSPWSHAAPSCWSASCSCPRVACRPSPLPRSPTCDGARARPRLAGSRSSRVGAHSSLGTTGRGSRCGRTRSSCCATTGSPCAPKETRPRPTGGRRCAASNRRPPRQRACTRGRASRCGNASLHP